MTKQIEKVAVLGSGTMGSQLAGHLANAGVPSLLFDLNNSQPIQENTKNKRCAADKALGDLQAARRRATIPAGWFHKN